MVWQGVVAVSPQVPLLAPDEETKIARSTSPSMPSQLLSVKASSGSSSGLNAEHMPQPPSPRQARTPPQVVLNGAGVRMSHDSVMPSFSATQSQNPLLGMHSS